MNKAEALRRQLELDLAKLQAECPHAELSDWMEMYWAPGHSSGYEVQACKECDKIVHERRHCAICRAELLDGNAIRGDGKELPFGVVVYCQKCFNDPDNPHRIHE